MFGWDDCAVRQDTFYPHQDYEQVNFYKKSRLFIIGGSLRDGKVTICLQLSQKWRVSTKTWQNYFFHQHTQTLYAVMQKEIENLEFVQSVNF